MRKIRSLVFFILTVACTGAFAQSDTKLANDITTMTADPSPWEKEEKTGLWSIERKTPGGQWFFAMSPTPPISITVKMSCLNGFEEQYWWSYGEVIAKGRNCDGKTTTIGTALFHTWIEPLPRDVLAPSLKKRKHL